MPFSTAPPEPANPGSAAFRPTTGHGLGHAVARLRAARLAQRSTPFVARGSRAERCADCRLLPSHCLCAWKTTVPTQVGVCLLMGDTEAMKPSNTGWLIADVVADTHAFAWSRTQMDPAAWALLADPQWQPVVVFPAEFVNPARVIHTLHPLHTIEGPTSRPLLVLLDGTWAEARKMFRKSPWLDHLPVLSLHPEQLSRYRLRRSNRTDHFCTAEVAALCLELAGEAHAAQVLDAYLDVFSTHYLAAREHLPLNLNDTVHQHLQTLRAARGHAPQKACP